MLSLCSIASGSSGNCIYVGTEETHLLIDVGISAKRIEEGLSEIGVEPEQLSAILITHEHSDHISGLSTFEKRYSVPVYATEGTLDAYLTDSKKDCGISTRLFTVDYGRSFQIGDILVSPFAISHDAVLPVSYTFEADGKKIGMATDLGTFTEETLRALMDSQILYIEANHELNILMVGKYPYSLKLRVSGERGHLSNEMAAQIVRKTLHPKMRHIVLGHLSKENNYPELAYETVWQEICEHWNFSGQKPSLQVACRDKISSKLILE